MDRRFLARCRACLVLALTITVLLLPAPRSGRAAEDEKPAEKKKEAEQAPEEPRSATMPVLGHNPQAPQVLDLAACRQMALEKQPALAAYRASLAAAEAKAQGLDALCVPGVIAPDLPIRRQQACLAVQIAAAQLGEAEWATIYDVTRCYCGVVYAREQIQLTETALDELEKLRVDVETAKGGRKQILEAHEIRRNTYVPMMRARREEALAGEARALAGLREAIGLGPDCCFDVVGRRLPRPLLTWCLHDMLDLALARRGELVRSTLAAAITDLEVAAQDKAHGSSVRTFASAGDIHAQPVPQEIHDGDYHPGAVPLEMPPYLVGKREYRVEQAHDLAGRAHAVVEKTRGLIVLEVEDLLKHLHGTARQLDELDTALQTASKDRYEKVKKQFLDVNLPVSLADVLDLGVLRTENRSQHNEALYHYLLLLAGLEKATAGGVCPFPTPAAPAHP
jgi:outer membrane protein TolC